MFKKALAQEKPGGVKPKVEDDRKKSSFIPSDGKWSLMPPSDGKASFMPSGEKPSLVDGKYSLLPGDSKPSMLPGDGKMSILGGDGKASIVSNDGKGSIQPNDGKASIQASIVPGDAKTSIQASIVPGDGKTSIQASIVPGDGKASIQASIVPGDAKTSIQASIVPGDGKTSIQASIVPGAEKTSILGDGKASITASIKPNDGKPSIPGTTKFSMMSSGKPSLAPGDPKPSLLPEIRPSLLPPPPEEAKHCCVQLAMNYIHKIPKIDDDEESQASSLDDLIQKPLRPSSEAQRLFKQSMKLESMVPRNREAWLDYLVAFVKKKIDIVYLNDKELRKVITRARPNLGQKKPEIEFDPDAPLCLSWTVEEMADWIESIGFPYLKDAFIVNQISGRHLILVDASALNQMGMSDLTEIRKVTSKIRDLLKIPTPNILRALMRIPPFERFLQKKVRLGPTTDALTFEQFCTQEGFIYSLLKGNKNAQIPCTCEVRILPVGVLDDDDDNLDDNLDDISLLNAPSVEYVVRNMAVRDATVAYIIELLLENVFLPNHLRQYGRLSETWKCGLVNTMERMCPDERLCFACDVAKGLMEELEHTAEVLSDINLLQKYISETITPDHLAWLQSCAAEFMENVVPIASLLALGELDLESIFKQDPEINEFVDGVVYDANEKLVGMGYESLPGVDDVEDYNDNRRYQGPQPQEELDEFDELFK